MTPKGGGRPGSRKDPFADEVTARVNPEGVPVTFDDLPTSPVSEPGAPAAPQPPYALIRAAGSGRLLALRVPNYSATGLAVEVPPEVDLGLVDGEVVRVLLHLAGDADADRVQVTAPARVAHQRKPSRGRPGGMALRWDVQNPAIRSELDLAFARARRPR